MHGVPGETNRGVLKEMKRLALFLKATTLGGLFVLLPVVVVLALLAKAVMGVRGAAQSLMEKLAGEGSHAVGHCRPRRRATSL